MLCSNFVRDFLGVAPPNGILLKALVRHASAITVGTALRAMVVINCSRGCFHLRLLQVVMLACWAGR